MGPHALADAILLVTPPTGAAGLANKIAPHDEQLNAGDVLLAGNFSWPNRLRPATTSISTTAHWARCPCVSSASKTDLAAAAVSVNGPQRLAKCRFCWSTTARDVRWL
jgi:2-keto-4-pentenoate hydratase